MVGCWSSGLFVLRLECCCFVCLVIHKCTSASKVILDEGTGQAAQKNNKTKHILTIEFRLQS